MTVLLKKKTSGDKFYVNMDQSIYIPFHYLTSSKVLYSKSCMTKQVYLLYCCLLVI